MIRVRNASLGIGGNAHPIPSKGMVISCTEVLKIGRIRQCSTMHHALSPKGNERTKSTPNAVVTLSTRDEATESTRSAAITLPARDENINQV